MFLPQSAIPILEEKDYPARMHVGKEPNYHTACEWWSDVRDYATPVGWKNHMFRFNVLFNGTLLADPAPRLIYAPWKRFVAWEGQGVQLNFPYLDAFHWWEHFGRGDNRMTRQSWTDNPTPVLRSEWPRYGLLIRQEIFGFIPGAGDVQTGLEPLFAWIRFSVADRVEALRPGVPPYNRHPLCVAISRPHIIPTMERRLNLLHRQEESLYPRALTPSTRYGARGYRLVEENGTVRLGVAPGSDCRVEYEDQCPETAGPMLRLWLLPEIGERVDLLVPMLPASAAEFRNVLALGFDGSLSQADGYWRRVNVQGADLSLPEKPVETTIRQCLRASHVITEKNATDGQYTLLTGSFGYPMVWSVQAALTMIFALDPWGRHEDVARALELYRTYQGQVAPPSPHLKAHRRSA